MRVLFIYTIWENGTTYSSRKKEPKGYIGYLGVAWHAVSQIGIRLVRLELCVSFFNVVYD